MRASGGEAGGGGGADLPVTEMSFKKLYCMKDTDMSRLRFGRNFKRKWRRMGTTTGERKCSISVERQLPSPSIPPLAYLLMLSTIAMEEAKQREKLVRVSVRWVDYATIFLTSCYGTSAEEAPLRRETESDALLLQTVHGRTREERSAESTKKSIPTVTWNTSNVESGVTFVTYSRGEGKHWQFLVFSRLQKYPTVAEAGGRNVNPTPPRE